MTVHTTAIACLDRLVAAIEAGAPDHRIAALRAAYDKAEAAVIRHDDALDALGVNDVLIAWGAHPDASKEPPC